MTLHQPRAGPRVTEAGLLHQPVGVHLARPLRHAQASLASLIPRISGADVTGYLGEFLTF